jgi:diguanylate cyclase (GGDEF)-like protein
VIEIDHYAQLAQWHGDHVAQLINRKLSKILATKVRQEDTVTQLAEGQFAVLSPSTDLIGCCAFGLRMQKAMEKLVMTYREERIRISVTVGVASSAVDGMSTVSHLIGVAVGRAESGRQMGGNRVIGDQGEVRQETVDRLLQQPLSIDQALAQLRLGDAAEVVGRLPAVIATLLPLLELVESRLRCGIPLEALEKISADAAGSDTSVQDH